MNRRFSLLEAPTLEIEDECALWKFFLRALLLAALFRKFLFPVDCVMFNVYYFFIRMTLVAAF